MSLEDTIIYQPPFGDSPARLALKLIIKEKINE